MANKSFVPSATVSNYQKKAKEYQKQMEQTLSRLENSSLGVAVQDALNRLTNRQPFSYDFNADGLYQQYKQQYQTLGNQAMKNILARAAEKTGGYANSYGVTAGTQAYNQYLDQLNNKIPQLYQLAYDRYNNQTKALQEEYSALASREQAQNSRLQSKADALWELAEYYTNLGNNQRSYELELWQEELNRAYQKERDEVKDAQWAKEFALAQAKAASSSSGGGSKANQDTKKISQWTAAEWEGYFANLRNKYGSLEAMERLQEMVENNIIPANMITFGVLGAKGQLKGH